MTEALDHRFWEIFRQGWAFREQDGGKNSETLLDGGVPDTLLCLRLDTPWAGYLPKLIWVIFIINHSGSIKNLIINFL